MSLTFHEEIGRVGRVGENVTRMLRGRYEEAAPVEFQVSYLSGGRRPTTEARSEMNNRKTLSRKLSRYRGCLSSNKVHRMRQNLLRRGGGVGAIRNSARDNRIYGRLK